MGCPTCMSFMLCGHSGFLIPKVIVTNTMSAVMSVCTVLDWCAVNCSNQKELVYTYDGLYEVTSAGLVTGQEGFKICK